ncbi:MAG: PAS domain-containing protein [Desulfuromusa sp.]|jgi:PAS domain S-box-containing protein|nr:PAS domain-containing protein [Desulfuromusa sp.]
MIFFTIVFVVGFGCFVFKYEAFSKQKDQDAIEDHAIVVASSVWTLFTPLTEQYLRLSVSHSGYKKVLITTLNGLELFSYENKLTGVDKFFHTIGAIRTHKITTPVIHKSQSIGTLTIEIYNKSIYIYSYLAVILLLVLALIWFIATITEERRNLRFRIKEKTMDLRKSENRLKRAVAGTRDGLWDWDLQTNEAYISDRFSTMLGYGLDELPHSGDAWVSLIHPEDLESTQATLRNYLDKRIDVYESTFRMKTKDGAYRWVTGRGEAVWDKDGTPIRITGFNTDVTDRKIAEQERLNLENQLRQKYKMEAVGVMAGGMAHNFNNNLSIILGNVELSKMKMPTNPEIDGYLKNAKIAVLRSRDLIQQILTYSRQDLKDKTSIQLTLVIDETLQLLRSTMPTTINLQQQISSDSHDLTINADPSQIQECLINLCNNAMHAMKEEGELTIALDSVELQKQDIPVQYEGQPGHYAKLRVQDNGSGMSAETVDKIFDLFFTTKPVDEGTGVGLSTVQGIVTQHGGLIKVNSHVGEGTTFELYFPMIEPTQVTETISVNEDMSGGTERILFVDDDPMLASLGEQILNIKGYTVSTFTDSIKALKKFTANPAQFDMVITDQTMPDLTGKELIQELKKIRVDIPTIICTGFSSKVDEDSAKELGASAFLMKPLDMPKLLQTVRRVLDGERE